MSIFTNSSIYFLSGLISNAWKFNIRPLLVDKDCVVYFDLLLGAGRTRKLVKLLFLSIFNLFCSFPLKKVWNEPKRLKTAEKKYFKQLSGGRSTQKLVERHSLLGGVVIIGKLLASGSSDLRSNPGKGYHLFWQKGIILKFD